MLCQPICALPGRARVTMRSEIRSGKQLLDLVDDAVLGCSCFHENDHRLKFAHHCTRVDFPRFTTVDDLGAAKVYEEFVISCNTDGQRNQVGEIRIITLEGDQFGETLPCLDPVVLLRTTDNPGVDPQEKNHRVDVLADGILADLIDFTQGSKVVIDTVVTLVIESQSQCDILFLLRSQVCLPLLFTICALEYHHVHQVHDVRDVAGKGIVLKDLTAHLSLFRGGEIKYAISVEYLIILGLSCICVKPLQEGVCLMEFLALPDDSDEGVEH